MLSLTNVKEAVNVRTHHREDGRGLRRSQQAVGRNAGVVPRILRDEAGDEKRSVHHDLHTRLQVPSKQTHTGRDVQGELQSKKETIQPARFSRVKQSFKTWRRFSFYFFFYSRVLHGCAQMEVEDSVSAKLEGAVPTLLQRKTENYCFTD